MAVFSNILNPLYLFHWTLLVGGVGQLRNDSISNDDLRNADNMLQDFVLLMGILYGPTKCTMNVHLLRHFAYYVLHRGPLWAYSCFAFEGMNAFIKPLMHGTHHAIEQIGCAIGLCFGLSNFTKKVFNNANVATDSKRLLRNLTGYSDHHSKTFSRVEGGYLCGKLKNTDLDNNTRTLVRLYTVVNRWSEDYELESYCRFKNHDGQKFYTTGVKTWKTDSTVIEYTENNMVHYGRVRMFLKLHNKGICICDTLEESSENSKFNMCGCDQSLWSLSVSDSDRNIICDVLQKYHDQQLVKHHVYVKPNFVGSHVILVEQIRQKYVLINISSDSWIISRFPNVIEHN